MASSISRAPMTSTRERPQRSVITSPMISSGLRACSATVTPRACNRSRRSAPVARELLETKARRRPARSSAASVSPAPEFRALPFQTHPSRSKTNPASVPSATAATPASVVLGAAEVGDRVGVHGLGTLGHARPGKLLLDATPARLAHRPRPGRILEGTPNSAGQLLGAARRRQHPRLAVPPPPADAADRRGDDRRPARHRLEVDEAEGLVDRRTYEDGRVTVKLDDLIDRHHPIDPEHV